MSLTLPNGAEIADDTNFGTGPVANTATITTPQGSVLTADTNYPPPWDD